MDKKQKSHIRPIVYVMITVFLTIGYAYLTSSLTINGSSLLKKTTWDVHFENIQVADGSVTGEQVIDEPEIDINQTTVTFHVNLKKPGDYYEFTVDAVNAGTIDAMVDNYSDLELTADQQKYLETSITYEDDEEVLEHQQLLAGDTAVYKVRVAYKLDLEADDLPSNPEQLDLEFSVEFVQRDGSAIKRSAESALYNVLKNEAKNGGLAIEYTGAHQDSMDSSRSTKKIYHWKVNNQTDLTNVNAKNNVYFGGYCWKILRTTDTGGVKLIYNGAAYEATCDKKGPDNQSFGQYELKNIGYGSYSYGTDYVYDENTKNYTLIDPIISSSTISDRYTCLSSSDTCSKLYYTVSPCYDPDYHGNWYYILTVSTTTAGSSIASVKQSEEENMRSINYSGYKIGQGLYTNSMKIVSKEQTFSKTASIFFTLTFKENYYYSKEIDQFTTAGTTYYRLVNPVLGSAIENGDITDYYTTNGSYTDYTTTLYYVAGLSSGTTFYALKMQTPYTLNYYNYVIGNGYTDNGDGTYTITNGSVVTQSDWVNNYSDYTSKYLCTNNLSTCSNPLLLISTTASSYKYIEASKKIVIAKNRNDLNLTQTKTVTLDDWLTDYESYGDFKYTCNDNVSTCTAQNLRFIIEYNSNGYIYNGNNYWGSSVTWDGSNYTLVNPITNEYEFDYNKISTHHYVCPNIYERTCSSIYYVYYNYGTSSYLYFINMRSGENNPSDVLNRYFTGNLYDSFHKKLIDKWYSHKLINYDDQIEDVIYCNDRSIYDYGGWNPNGGDVRNPLLFNSNSNNRLTLDCANLTDKFSVSNEQAKLKYKIALPTATELYLNGYRVSSDDDYKSIVDGKWTMTPSYHDYGIYMKNFDKNYDSAYDTYSISPTISLIHNTRFTEGDGSLANPYYIGSTHNINYEDNDLELSRVGSVGKRIRVKLKDDEYRVTSFKINGETITGRTFIMPDEDVTITDVVKTKATIVESGHNPYSPYLEKTYLDKTFEGAVSLDIELTYQSDNIYVDWVYLYNDPSSSTPYNSKRFGGTKMITEDITLDSNYLKIVFYTDGSENNYYGFKAAIMPIYE